MGKIKGKQKVRLHPVSMCTQHISPPNLESLSVSQATVSLLKPSLTPTLLPPSHLAQTYPLPLPLPDPTSRSLALAEGRRSLRQDVGHELVEAFGVLLRVHSRDLGPRL